MLMPLSTGRTFSIFSAEKIAATFAENLTSHGRGCRIVVNSSQWLKEEQ